MYGASSRAARPGSAVAEDNDDWADETYETNLLPPLLSRSRPGSGVRPALRPQSARDAHQCAPTAPPAACCIAPLKLAHPCPSRGADDGRRGRCSCGNCGRCGGVMAHRDKESLADEIGRLTAALRDSAASSAVALAAADDRASALRAAIAAHRPAGAPLPSRPGSARARAAPGAPSLSLSRAMGLKARELEETNAALVAEIDRLRGDARVAGAQSIKTHVAAFQAEAARLGAALALTEDATAALTAENIQLRAAVVVMDDEGRRCRDKEAALVDRAQAAAAAAATTAAAHARVAADAAGLARVTARLRAAKRAARITLDDATAERAVCLRAAMAARETLGVSATVHGGGGAARLAAAGAEEAYDAASEAVRHAAESLAAAARALVAFEQVDGLGMQALGLAKRVAFQGRRIETAASRGAAAAKAAVAAGRRLTRTESACVKWASRVADMEARLAQRATAGGCALHPTRCPGDPPSPVRLGRPSPSPLATEPSSERGYDAVISPGQSIMEAVWRCGLGAYILLRPGDYAESLVLTEPVHIFGRGSATITCAEEGTSAVVSTAARGTLDGVTIICTGGGGQLAIDICGGALDLRNCAIKYGDSTGEGGATQPAVRISGKHTDPRVFNNKIFVFGRGGVACVGGWGRIEQNAIWAGVGDGISVSGGADPVIDKNSIHNCSGHGIVIQGPSRDVSSGDGGYDDDGVEGDDDDGGLGSRRGPAWLPSGKGRLTGNTVFDNGGCGIAVAAGGAPTLRGNVVYDNAGAGLWLETGSRAVGGDGETNEVRGNGNGTGIGTGGRDIVDEAADALRAEAAARAAAAAAAAARAAAYVTYSVTLAAGAVVTCATPLLVDLTGTRPPHVLTGVLSRCAEPGQPLAACTVNIVGDDLGYLPSVRVYATAEDGAVTLPALGVTITKRPLAAAPGAPVAPAAVFPGLAATPLAESVMPNAAPAPSAVTYGLTFATSDIKSAGTNARVTVELVGTLGSSGRQEMPSQREVHFARGGIDTFKFSCADLGPLTRLSVSHDNSGVGAGWHLEEVQVACDAAPGAPPVRFPCNGWLEKHRHSLSRDLYPEGVEPPPPLPGGEAIGSRFSAFGSSSGRFAAAKVAAAVGASKPAPVTATAAEEQGTPVPVPPAPPAYRCTFFTSDVKAAGTKAAVEVEIMGAGGDTTDWVPAVPRSDLGFDRGSAETIGLSCSDVGPPRRIRVRHDNSGAGAGWFLDRVEVERPGPGGVPGPVTIFPCAGWLEAFQGTLCRELPPETERGYRFTVRTSDRRAAGTEAAVAITVHGDGGNTTGPLAVRPRAGPEFARGSTELVEVPAASVGRMSRLTVAHDNAGPGAGWHLSSITAEDITTGEVVDFGCDDWLEARGGTTTRTLARADEKGYLIAIKTIGLGGTVAGLLRLAVVGDGGVTALTPLTEGMISTPGPGGVTTERLTLSAKNVGRLMRAHLEIEAGAAAGAPWTLESLTLDSCFTGQSVTYPVSRAVGATAPPGLPRLFSVGPPGEKGYRLSVRTSDMRAAGTSARVYASLIGEKGETGPVPISPPDPSAEFERGSTVEAVMPCADVGRLLSLRLRHDNTGVGAGWHVHDVTAESLETSEVATFVVAGWLEAYQGTLERLVLRAESRGYRLAITTSVEDGAGTDGGVTVTLVGEGGTTGPLAVEPRSRTGGFEAGMTETVLVPCADMGTLSSLTLCVDGAGERPGWRPSRITAESLTTSAVTAFDCGTWLNDRGAGAAVTLVPATTPGVSDPPVADTPSPPEPEAPPRPSLARSVSAAAAAAATAAVAATAPAVVDPGLVPSIAEEADAEQEAEVPLEMESGPAGVLSPPAGEVYSSDSLGDSTIAEEPAGIGMAEATAEPVADETEAEPVVAETITETVAEPVVEPETVAEAVAYDDNDTEPERTADERPAKRPAPGARPGTASKAHRSPAAAGAPAPVLFSDSDEGEEAIDYADDFDSYTKSLPPVPPSLGGTTADVPEHEADAEEAVPENVPEA